MDTKFMCWLALQWTNSCSIAILLPIFQFFFQSRPVFHSLTTSANLGAARGRDVAIKKNAKPLGWMCVKIQFHRLFAFLCQKNVHVSKCVPNKASGYGSHILACQARGCLEGIHYHSIWTMSQRSPHTAQTSRTIVIDWLIHFLVK